jgi:hypothetical protein
MMPRPPRLPREKARLLRLALVPFRLGSLPDDRCVVNYGAPIWLGDSRSKRKQRSVYKALLQCRWLAPKVRNAIVAELGLSVRQEQRRVAQLQADLLRAEIDEQKWRMRKNGEQHREGIHDAAMERVANRRGTTVSALVKQLQRATRNARR